MADHRKLRVLVCTANLGNARPDKASIAAMIPEDGCFSQVTAKKRKYPLCSQSEQEALLKEMGLGPKDGIMPYRGTSVRGSQGSALDGIPDGEEIKMIDDSEARTDDYFDIIVVGMQEATFEVASDDPVTILPVIQPIMANAVTKAAHLGHSLVDSVAKSRDYTKELRISDWLDARDSKVIGQLLGERLPSYNFSVRYQRGEMRLEILTRDSLICETLCVRAQNTGIGTAGVNLPNKGGIVAELLVDNSTRLTFCTAHLQAHEGKDKYDDRCKMATSILEGTADNNSSNIPIDLSLKSHVTFFLGDLNFRTALSSGDLSDEEHKARVRKLVKKKDWRALNKADELFKALKQRDCLCTFKTMPCYFPPTFKVERGTGCSYQDQRTPSYTDRILYRTVHKLEQGVTPLTYEPITKFITSDHKPVRGAFEVVLNQKLQPRPPLGERRRSRLSMSMQNVFSRANHKMGGDAGSKMHLFISDIRCTIQKRNFMPDPYIVFMSVPSELIQQEINKWQKFKGKLAKFNYGLQLETARGDGGKTRTLNGFPRTKKLRSTVSPMWLDEYHLTVETHNRNSGEPLNLTGSMLLVVLLDHCKTIESTVIGTFPLNLAHLCASTSKFPTSARGKSPSRWTALSRTISGRDSSRAKKMGVGSSCHSSGSGDNRILKMKQPLLRDGKQKGTISFSMDAKWLSDHEVADEHGRRFAVRRGSSVSFFRRKGSANFTNLQQEAHTAMSKSHH